MNAAFREAFRFDGTDRNEFLRVKARETLCETAEALRRNLNRWLVHDNAESPSLGSRNQPLPDPSGPSTSSHGKKLERTHHTPR